MKVNNGILSDYEALRVAIIPQGRKRRPQINMNPKNITIHNTGVTNVAADNFKRGCHDITQDMEVSYHFVVDEKEVVQLLPINEVGWHAGDKKGNYTSIGIEVCEREGAEDNAIKFVAALLEVLGMKADQLKTHKEWSGKQCPRLILPHWETFRLKVNEAMTDTQEIEIMLNGTLKRVQVINKDGNNFVRLRDLADSKIEVLYDKVAKRPVVNVRG
ncbi:MAG: peptidoglycan recognition protein family protein [Peptostreptococcaceae bacterium]